MCALPLIKEREILKKSLKEFLTLQRKKVKGLDWIWINPLSLTSVFHLVSLNKLEPIS